MHVPMYVQKKKKNQVRAEEEEEQEQEEEDARTYVREEEEEGTCKYQPVRARTQVRARTSRLVRAHTL